MIKYTKPTINTAHHQVLTPETYPATKAKAQTKVPDNAIR